MSAGRRIAAVVTAGSFRIGDQLLNSRDGLGIDNQGIDNPGPDDQAIDNRGPDGQATITATAKDNDSEILIMEIPMNNKIH